MAHDAEQIMTLTLYAPDVGALPLGHLHGVEESWEQGWDPADKLEDLVCRQCAEQLRHE